MILKYYKNNDFDDSGFSVMDVDELFYIAGGSEKQDLSEDKEKGYDTTWELEVSGDVTVDTNGKVDPKITFVYTVHK